MFEVDSRWTPHPVIVTIGQNRIVLGSSSIPIIPLLQGRGGPPKVDWKFPEKDSELLFSTAT